MSIKLPKAISNKSISIRYYLQFLVTVVGTRKIHAYNVADIPITKQHKIHRTDLCLFDLLFNYSLWMKTLLQDEPNTDVFLT